MMEENRNAVRVKWAYLFLFSSLGVFSPYLPLFYAHLGISKAEIGVLTGLAPLIILFASPTITAIADACKGRNQVLMIGALVGTLGRLALLVCGSSFLRLFPFVVLFAAATSALPPLMDSLAVDNCTSSYGSLRAYGCVGFGLSSLVSGFLVSDGTFWRIFVAQSLCTVALVSVLFTYKGEPKLHRAAKHDEPSESILKRLAKVFGRSDVRLFFALTLLSGMFNGCIDAFLFLRLQELGAIGLCFGLARAINCASEVPFFWSSRALIEKLGLFNVMAVAQFAYVIRFITYSFVSNPWGVLPVETFHGMTFAAFYASGVYFVRAVAPSGSTTMMQGLLSALYWGTGYGGGALLSGFIYEHLGVEIMYTGAAGLAAVGCCLALLLSKISTLTTEEVFREKELETPLIVDAEILKGEVQAAEC